MREHVPPFELLQDRRCRPVNAPSEGRRFNTSRHFFWKHALRISIRAAAKDVLPLVYFHSLRPPPLVLRNYFDLRTAVCRTDVWKRENG